MTVLYARVYLVIRSRTRRGGSTGGRPTPSFWTSAFQPSAWSRAGVRESGSSGQEASGSFRTAPFVDGFGGSAAAVGSGVQGTSGCKDRSVQSGRAVPQDGKITTDDEVDVDFGTKRECVLLYALADVFRRRLRRREINLEKYLEKY